MEKQYDHLKQESQITEFWHQHGVFDFRNGEHEVFSIDTPPPTVSGSLHIGHIFSYTHADLIARYKRMSGLAVFYPMGFDDNGLPTERFVEKQHQVRAQSMKRSDFIALCLKETANVEKQFEQLWQKLGLSIDWSKKYSTIEPRVRKTSQYSFIDLYKKGLIERRAEPSLYCTTCNTSVAQAELDDAEVTSTFYTIDFATTTGEKLPIATTRPELLPACVALFCNPHDKRYTHLVGHQATTPVFNRTVTIMADELVDKDKGTGLVMCCTFGDSTDITWYKKHALPFVQAIGNDGRWTAITGPLAGMKVQDARKKTIELLESAGALKDQKKITHAVNVHERCGQGIEYLVLMQWFVKILEHKQEFLARGDEIEWSPAFMKSRYKDWVEHLAWDWCISRQRFFGIPFPVWHCKDCGAVLLASPKDLPIDPQEQPYPDSICDKCSSKNLVPDTDVMDTWATSALTPQINAGWPDNTEIELPMSMRPQAHDIIRTWAFYTIVKAHYHHHKIPWKKVTISGHVLAGHGGKISKSKGGGPMDPSQLLATYSADAVRYWAAGGKLGLDTAFSETQLRVGQRLVTKLWNAFLFCSEHMQGGESVNVAAGLTPVSRWLFYKFEGTKLRYHNYFATDDYSGALEVIEQFFWHDFCDNYLELVKDQLFNPHNYVKAEVDATRYTLYEVGFGILQLYAPFAPFVTEAIYQELFKKTIQTESLHLSRFVTVKTLPFDYTDSYREIELALQVITAVRKAKSEQAVSLKTPVSLLEIYGGDRGIVTSIEPHKKLIAGITKAIDITCTVGNETPLVERHDDQLHIKVVLHADTH